MIFEQSKFPALLFLPVCKHNAVSNIERERKKAESVTDHPHADGVAIDEWVGARRTTRERHARERDGHNGRTRWKLTVRFKRRYLGNGESYRRGSNGILKGMFD